MPSSVPDSELSEAIFQAVQDGSYPEDELIVSAELPSSAVKQLSELLDEARADVKVGRLELPTSDFTPLTTFCRRALAN